MISWFSGEKRIQVFGSLIITLMTAQFNTAWAQVPGEELYQTMCAACHTIGGGRLVGPDLENVHNKRSQEWLEKFIPAARSMIDSGDAEAVAVFEEYNKMPMPDFPVSNEQVNQIVAYIKSRSSVAAESTAEQRRPAGAEADAVAGDRGDDRLGAG